MSGHHDPTNVPATGSNRSIDPLYNDPSRAVEDIRIRQQPSPNGGEQPGIARHMEHHPLTRIQYLEMRLGGHYRYIRDYFQRFIWPLPATEVNSDRELLAIDPNTMEIVHKGFIAEAHRNHKELGDLRQVMNKNMEECANFRQALKEKIEECDEIRGHWQSAIGELSDLKSSKQVFMVDDAEMISKWNQVQYSIKNLAMIYLRTPISPKHLTQEQEALLRPVSPLYQEFLSTKGQAHLLFQSLVWMHVTEEILWNPTRVWGEPVSGAFRTLLNVGPGKLHRNSYRTYFLNIITESKKDYHTWRAETGGIIQNTRGISNSRTNNLKAGMEWVVVQFISKETLADKRHRDIIRRSVVRIIDKAIEIAVIFNQSRCFYDLRRVVHREPFSPTSMEYNEECDASHVDLMISPGLVKFGNSKGEHYDQRLVLVKSHVCTLKQDTEEEEDGDTDGSDGEGSKEGKDEEESDSLIEL
ncbi:hypothetical protein F4803DRAFT_575272 [Xylaria telfairii]|nr:hypothetical protein F4803DRAFT_575272 [Xylaria telfairii]